MPESVVYHSAETFWRDYVAEDRRCWMVAKNITMKWTAAVAIEPVEVTDAQTERVIGTVSDLAEVIKHGGWRVELAYNVIYC